MKEPTNLIPSPIEEAVLLHAFEMIEAGGLSSIHPALRHLRESGIDPIASAVEPVIVEALFQMLEVLEQNLDDPVLFEVIASFNPMVAGSAAHILVSAHFPDGHIQLSDLGDGSVILLAALYAAAGKLSEGIDILRRSRFERGGQSFQDAALKRMFLLQNDDQGVIQLLFEQTLDGLDHPEIWNILPAIVGNFPSLIGEIAKLLDNELKFYTEFWSVIHALCVAAEGDLERGLALLNPIATAHSQSTMVQGAYFHIKGLLDPQNPAFDLTSRFCSLPFDELDVLDGKSHLCCASWLPQSVGDLAEQPWREVWNSDTAQSILDGSFRFCNKTACPKIADNKLPRKDQLVANSDRWRDVIENFRTRLAHAPERVNLAYDQTCNLSCPSCRTGKVAADAATRARFDKLQDEQILPLLRQVKLAFITGSGDPFASRNFRNLLDRLGPEDYPDLRFQVMTNGMLFTPREWDRFPTLHGRTAFLRISLDAATGPTHELLRRGARWPVMEQNLAFAAKLRSEGLIDRLEISFTVQVDNFAEMGDAVDLARHYNADNISFTRLTNWGTFTAEQYAQKAVFMPGHSQHGDFLQYMRDPRLRDPIASLHDLSQYAPAAQPRVTAG